MTKIKATPGYKFYRDREIKKKWHLAFNQDQKRPPCSLDGLLPHIEHSLGFETADAIALHSLCGHCRKLTDAYEETPQHITAMPDGYRIMEVGETITKGALCWCRGSETWEETSIAGCTVEAGRYCCPVDVQKTPETSDNADRGEPVSDKEYHGGLATPEERDRLLSRIAELERKNELLIQTIEANPSKAKVAELEKERDELKRKVDQLIAIDKRVTDYIDDLHREHEAEVNELKRRLDASAEASVHERTTVAMLTEKLEKAEAERDDYRSQIIEIEKAHDALCDATKGYTLENITTFIEAMPPAEDLEGYEVEYRYPRIGDSAWLNHELRWKVVEKEQRCSISAIVRTPIIEYIPTEDITDALARDRVVCDVRYSCKTQWIPAVLLVVDGRPEKSVKYLVQLIESEDFVWFQVDHCRIRKDTIESLRGNK